MKLSTSLGYSILANLLISFLGGCLTVSIFLVMMSHFLSARPVLATVDMTGLIHNFVKTESTIAASVAQHQASVHVFSQELDSALKNVAEEKHVILVPKEAVIAGAVTDLTPEVAEQLEKFQSAESSPREISEK